MFQVMAAGVTVHTIAFTWQADSSMDALAQATGGLVFLYSDLDTSNALNDAFQTIGELNLSEKPSLLHHAKRKAQFIAVFQTYLFFP